jgi:hypothetical protein
MRRPYRLGLPLLVVALLGLFAACGGGDGDTDAPTTTGLETNFDVTPRENVTMLDEDTVEDRIVSADPAAGEYRFESGTDLGAATVGQPIVIPGKGFGIVREVVEDGDQVVLRVDEATLGDVIQDGTAEWQYDVSWSDFDVTYEELAALPGVTSVEIVRGTDAGGFQDIAYQTPTPRKITIKFTRSNWEFILEIEPKDGKLNYKITGSLRAANQTVASVSGAGWVSGFSYSSLLEYSDGTPSNMTTEINGIQGEMEIKWAAFRTPNVAISQVVRVNVPLAMPIPIPGPFGIPFVLQLKMAGRIVPELTADQSSSGGSWKLTYSSDQGFSVEDSAGSATGSLKSENIDTSGETVTAGYGPAGFGVGLEFPRFELGVAGLQPFAFITVDMYSTSLWTPGTTLTSDIPPCQYGYTKLSAVAGYQLQILGWGGLTDQYTLWEKQLNKYLDGKECTLTGE